MEKTRSKNNRTLTITEEEKAALKNTIYNINDLKHSYKDNSIINGDLFECLDYIPNEYFNLIIIDPPYNLTKDFHGNKFNNMKSSDYEDYLHSWFYKVCDKLTPDGTLYMCGDWKCTSSMQKVIEERLTILNRITWQREKGRGAKKLGRSYCGIEINEEYCLWAAKRILRANTDNSIQGYDGIFWERNSGLKLKY